MMIRRQIRPINQLLETAIPAGDSPASGPSTSGQPAVIDVLGLAAQYAALQFQLLLSVTIHDDDRRRAVPAVLRAAIDLDRSSADAVDAFAHLVSCVVAGDEREFARTATGARQRLGDEDVVAGASALIAAFSDRIAATTVLDVTDVDALLAEAWTAPHCSAGGTSARRHERRMCQLRLRAVAADTRSI